MWQQLRQFPIGNVADDYLLMIEAVSSGVSDEIIAVDEFVMANCAPPSPCVNVPEGYLICLNQACFPSDVQCDFTNDCGDYSDEAVCGKAEILFVRLLIS